MRSYVLITAALLAGAICATSNAKPLAPVQIELNRTTPEELLTIVQGWQGKFEDGNVLLDRNEEKTYSARLLALQEKINAIDDFAALPKAQKIALTNEYEALRAQTDGGEARGNRKVCQREKPIGSNRFVLVCITAAHQKRMDKLNQAVLSDIERNGRRHTTTFN